MPYTRRRRRPYRRYRRNYRTSKRLYRAINKVVSKKLEAKYIDHADEVGVPIGGYLVDLTDTAQGVSDAGERIGDKIQWLSMVQKGLIVCGDDWNTVRIMIVQWKEDDQNDPVTLAQVLQDVTYPWMSAYNHDNGFKFSVLYDRMFTGIGNDTAGHGPRTVRYSFKIRSTGKFTSKTIKYKGATAYGKGKLFLLMASDSNAVSDPIVNYYNRIIYTDA